MNAVCAYSPCQEPLTGRRAGALYCSRRHKEQARKARSAALAVREKHWTCDECGTLYLGKPPYCPDHQPEGITR